MKRKYYSLFVASMMLLAASSCSQDEDIRSMTPDNGTVSFKVQLEGAAQSRTAGDGKTVNRLYYEVYQGGTKVLDNYGPDANVEEETVIDKGAATVEMPLMRGEKYKIMFWAQYVPEAGEPASIYDATDLQNIKVDYANAQANMETYDAFFFGDPEFQATTNVTTVVLTRPFGQLNIGTTVADWEKAIGMIDAGLPVNASQIEVSGLANRFDVLTHAASVEGEVGKVTFTKAALTGETFEVKVSETEKAEYQNLAMNYLLVPTSQGIHQGTVDMTATFWRKADSEKLFDIVLPYVPITRNWRTNILGDLLAADKTFEIVIDPIFDGDYNYPKTMEEQLRMAAAIGGAVTLTEDVTLTSPLLAQHDMTIDLNGHTITGSGITNQGVVEVLGSDVTIKGEAGKITTIGSYAVWVKNGGSVTIESGTYEATNSTQIVYVEEGTAYIKGGQFQVDSKWNGKSYEDANGNHMYTLNCADAAYDNDEAKIVVTGGSFYKFNPGNNVAESAGTNFVAEGYETKTSGDWTTVIGDVTDIVVKDDHAEVYTAEGLLQFVNIVNSEAAKNGYDLKLMSDIEMPLFTIEQNADGEYVYTDTPITFDENGVPSGSNWVPICAGYVDKEWEKAYQGHIEGNGNTIKGLVVLQDCDYVGFVAAMYDNASIKNLTIANAFIKGQSNTGIVGGRSQHGGVIENVHVKNSQIIGTSEVGGIVGRNYRRDKIDVDEDLAYVKDCSIDATSIVKGTASVGGICGYNYGAVILNCTNSATVTGNDHVGGIVGYSREYNTGGINGYVIACGSTADAKITATNNNAGGVVGQNMSDTNHDATTFIVACYSNSQSITGTPRGLIAGVRTYNGVIYGSWAEKIDGLPLCSGDNDGYIFGSSVFASTTSITEEKVQEMNDAIATFNALNAEGIQCEYKWEWVSGSWPKLVPSVNNN